MIATIMAGCVLSGLATTFAVNYRHNQTYSVIASYIVRFKTAADYQPAQHLN